VGILKAETKAFLQDLQNLLFKLLINRSLMIIKPEHGGGPLGSQTLFKMGLQVRKMGCSFRIL
jgi:hypothetical protein